MQAVHPLRKVAQETAGTAGSVERGVLVGLAGDLQDDRAMESDPNHLPQQPRPVDSALARRQMIVALPVIVCRMHHPKMAGELMRDRPQVAGELSMARVEADAGLRRFQSATDPE